MKIREWDENVANTWRFKLPPVRPAFFELAEIEKVLARVKTGKKVLILGTTAEFIDLAYRKGLDITIADKDRGNFAVLNKTRYHYMAHKEKLVVKNWLDLDGKYDVILGDLVLNVLPFDKQNILLRKLKNLIKKDGIIVLRTWVLDKKKNIKTLVKGYDGKVPIFSYYALPLLRYFYDHKKNYVICRDVVFELKKLWKEGIVPKDVFEEFKKQWSVRYLPDWIPKKDDLERDLKKYFRIRKIGLIYVLKRKN